MKRLLFVSVLFVVMSFSAFATQYDLYCLTVGACGPKSFTDAETLGTATFSDFTVTASSVPSGDGNPTTPLTSQHEIVLNTPSGTGYPGFYTSGDNLTATAYPNSTTTYTLDLDYLVSGTSPWASDVEGSFQANCSSGGGATGVCAASMTETVYAATGPITGPTIGSQLGTFTISGSAPIGSVISVPVTGMGGTAFAPQSEIYIEKVITVLAHDTDTSPNNSITAGVTVFDQIITPEPGFYGLVACGLSALFMIKRKRHQS